MVSGQHYEEILNWFYDRSLEGRIELKATCAPHYFRIARQRRAEARRAGLPVTELHGSGRPGHEMHAMTRGWLAGSGVCFISHREDVYPCGYLPVSAGSLRKQAFHDVWENADVFRGIAGSRLAGWQVRRLRVQARVSGLPGPGL